MFRFILRIKSSDTLKILCIVLYGSLGHQNTKQGSNQGPVFAKESCAATSYIYIYIYAHYAGVCFGAIPGLVFTTHLFVLLVCAPVLCLFPD